MSAYENSFDEFNVVYDNLYEFNNFDLFEVKLGSITRPQIKAYTADKYEKEAHLITKNDKGEDTEKIISHNNFIRWKYSKDKALREKKEINDDEELINEPTSNNCFEKELNETLGMRNLTSASIESNCKMVEWSDGSIQMLIGDKYFDIMISDMVNNRIGTLDQDNDLVVIGKKIKKKMILQLNEETDLLAKKNENDDDVNNSKIKLSYSYFDKNEYVKDDHSKFSKFNKSTKQKTPTSNEFNKRKRKRSGNSLFDSN